MVTEPQDKTQVGEKQPGLQHKMKAQPESTRLPTETESQDVPTLEEYKAAEKLKDQVAVITGGDSGIGRAVAVLFAKEGAKVSIIYLPKEEQDAQETKLDKTIQEFGKIDILVNNAGVQHFVSDLCDLSSEQLEQTFRVNVFGYVYMTQACLRHMKKGSKIINTSSVVAYEGHPTLIDYSMTKGAEIAFTRSLAKQLGPKGIRVNAVAPGPILTPLQPASRDQEGYTEFLKSKTLLVRVGQPTCYVFLASTDSSYMTGQTLHPNGGTIVNG